MASRGQSEVLTAVILVSAIMALAAVFLVISMRSFNSESSYYSITYVASFLSNVADDIDTYMMMPGTQLTYALPNTEYGVYNFVNTGDAHCTVSVALSGQTIITEESGVLIYGVSPSYYSMPSGFMYVWRGSNAIGFPTVNPRDLSTVVVPKSFAPTGTVVSLVQLGYGEINGLTYGSSLVMIPRVIAMNGTSNGGVGYVYIPVFTELSTPSVGRGTLIVKVISVSSSSVNNPTGELKVVETCSIGGYAIPQGRADNATVTGGTVYIVIIEIGFGLGGS